MTPTTSTHGPESDDGWQDAPGATDAATEAREAIDLDAIETRAKAVPTDLDRWRANANLGGVPNLVDMQGEPATFMVLHTDRTDDALRVIRDHIAGMDPAATLALVRELREARAEVWADVAALLNDRAQMFEDAGRPVLTRELRGLANAYRTYAEGVGIPSIQSLREKRRAAEDERDDLRARLAKVEADLIVSEADRDRYKDAFLRANEACTVREAAILDLQAERDSAEAHASVLCEAETRLAKVEAARGALGTVRRTAPRTLYDQGYQDGQTDERAVIVASLDAALGGDR